MKIKFYGKKPEWYGKTLWEIVGNLKNFGVGRLVRRWHAENYTEPCFMKIIKVQPLPPPRNQYEDRPVIVWVDEVFRGIKYPTKEIRKDSELSKYELIPKAEEEKYLKEAEEFSKTFQPEEVPKYSPCPPLFKILWEKQHLRQTKKIRTMPNINVVLNPQLLFSVKLSEEEKTSLPSSTSLHKTNVPVEDMIKEIVKLRKIIREHSLKS